MRHRVTAVVGWLLFVGVAMAAGSMAGQRTMTEDQYATGDSARAIQILDEAGLKTPAGELILVTGTGPATSPATRAAVTDLMARLQAATSSPAWSTPTPADGLRRRALGAGARVDDR